MATWPPTLDLLKQDMGIDMSDTRDDQRLTQVLTAAQAFVERARAGEVDFTGTDPTPDGYVPVGDDLVLGTLRLAGRWHVRRRSPDLLIAAGELGTSRVPAFDSDIERLLRIGKFRKGLFA